MFKILFEEYCKHKKWILLYVCLCIFASVFCGPFLNDYLPGTAAISASSDATGIAENITLSESETLSTLTDKILGNSISSIAGGYASVVAISCEPFSALLFLGIIETINRWCGYPLDMLSTPAGNPIVLLVIAIFWAVSKFMKSNETTQIFGMVTLGELEKYLGLAFILILGVLNVTGISTGVMDAVLSAASPERAATPSGATWITIVSIVWSVILSIMSVAVFFIMKTVMSGIDVLQVSLSFIPGSAFIFETCKTLFALFLITVNVICPPLGIALNIIIFIIGCILFKICYRAVRYFKSIYFRPLFKRIKGFDPQMPLVSNKLPKRIRKYCQAQGLDIKLAIPVYPLKYLGEEKVRKYDRWWLMNDGETTFYIRKRAGKKKVRKLSFEQSYGAPIYLRKGLWSYEIFSYLPNEDNLNKKFPKKAFSFALSMEYLYKADEIMQITGFENYNLIREANKLTKRQQREERRMRRKEAILQKIDNIKYKLDQNPDKQR